MHHKALGQLHENRVLKQELVNLKPFVVVRSGRTLAAGKSPGYGMIDRAGIELTNRPRRKELRYNSFQTFISSYHTEISAYYLRNHDICRLCSPSVCSRIM